MVRLPTAVLSFLLLAGPSTAGRAEDHPAPAGKVHKKEQQFEEEVKTERDRPQKKERARAAGGRVEDGVRDFGRGLQGVMKEAGIGDGPASAGKKPESRPAAPAKPAPKKTAKPKATAPAAPAAPVK